MSIDLETPRLILRRPRLTDVPALFEFMGDTQAMQYTQAHASFRDSRRQVAVCEYRRRHDGYAPWTIISKADDRVIGWGGLYEDPFDPGWGVEVIYRFHPSSWGCGFASELVSACMTFADKTLGLPEVRGFTHPDNIASQRILEKSGFVKMRYVEDMDRLLWRRMALTEPHA